MKWYHWVKVVGIMATAIGGSLPLVLLAIALHLLSDFTLQSDSPCAPFSSPNPECDLIGSEPIGCQPPTGVWPSAEGGSWGGVKALFREGTD